MTRRFDWPLLSALLLAFGACAQETGSDGCQKDSECKGDRICVDSECVSPDGDDDMTSEPSEGPSFASPTEDDDRGNELEVEPAEPEPNSNEPSPSPEAEPASEPEPTSTEPEAVPEPSPIVSEPEPVTEPSMNANRTCTPLTDEERCGNGVMDGDEEGLDCGGPCAVDCESRLPTGACSANPPECYSSCNNAGLNAFKANCAVDLGQGDDCAEVFEASFALGCRQRYHDFVISDECDCNVTPRIQVSGSYEVCATVNCVVGSATLDCTEGTLVDDACCGGSSIAFAYECGGKNLSATLSIAVSPIEDICSEYDLTVRY